jgi:hypothetical protein
MALAVVNAIPDFAILPAPDLAGRPLRVLLAQFEESRSKQFRAHVVRNSKPDAALRNSDMVYFRGTSYAPTFRAICPSK